ncbi:MAG: efflux transporter outer membrane subunit [Deltaproteobacteria bacterium]|nr:efflux transporter outer membrane subunit [Deltaproteobacteria bacterium]
MRRFFLIFCTLLLTGCMAGPDYSRPAVNSPEVYRYGVKEARDSANTLWWKQFHDPVLDTLIEEALGNNKDIRIAAANVEQAAGMLTQVRSPLFPQASYNGSGARQRLSEENAAPLPGSVPNPQEAYQVFAGATWEIDLWGRVRRLSEAARANLLGTEEARRGIILSVVALAATNYFELCGLDEQLAIARQNLASYGESVRLFELQHKYGQVSRMTVEQARTRYETAAATIPQIESQIVHIENALSLLLGRNPGPVSRGRTLGELALPEVPADLPSELLANRPDIMQAEQNLIAANAQIGAARTLYFPTISLTAGYGQASGHLSDLFKSPARTWNYGGTITGPIFTAGAVSGQVQQAEAAHKAALLAYELSIQNAFSDVENALATRSKIIEQLQAQKRLVDAAGEYTRLSKLLYDGGYAPYSTVLQAEEQSFPAQLNYVMYRASLFASLVNIYKAMGGGWITEADKLTEVRDKNTDAGKKAP